MGRRSKSSDGYSNGLWTQVCLAALHENATYLDDRPIPDAFKLELYVRIVRLYLEDDDAVSAETYFNRATLLIRGNEDKALNRKPALGPPSLKHKSQS